MADPTQIPTAPLPAHAAPLAPPSSAPSSTPSAPSSTTAPSGAAGSAFARIDDHDQMPEEDEAEDYDPQEEDYFDEEEEEEEDEYDADKALGRAMAEVDDQDWGDLHGDFTRRYNRMRQHVVATHSALPNNTRQNNTTARPTAVLPASNRPRAAPKAPVSASEAKGAVHTNKVSDQLATYSKYNSQIDLAPLYSTNAAQSRKGGSEKILIKDKADRATNEQVLDPRTRLILFKMLGRGLLERVDGCVSTGKEANVYHAVSPIGEQGEPSRHLALKIYKTSILIFKDRDRYVTGEFRFKSGYARSNPRKMVRLWAEKEMRNLRRLKTGGLRVPEPLEVRENVLVMEFMAEANGEDEWQASPRLKDAHLPQERHRPLYLEILLLLRVIYHRCKLVHADFSEYNILYHQEHLWVIDVSQSVEQDHPAAFDFLRQDIKNADDFFRRLGVDTLGLTRTFNFVTGPSWISGEKETDEDILLRAEELVVEVENASSDLDEDEEEEIDPSTINGLKKKAQKPTESDEAVFAQSYIPRALDQVYDPERDVARVLRGEGEGLIYADITGVAKIRLDEREEQQEREDAEGQQQEGGVKGEEGESGEEDGSGDEDESGSESGSDGERRPRGKKFEDRDEKKARRNETKEKAREKRKQKMKKSDKAKKVKKTSGKK